jgi:hypothetical protein
MATVSSSGSPWTIALATTGVALALLSLVWQFVTWRRSGSHVKAELTTRFPPLEKHFAYPMGLHLVLTVNNVGRLPAELVGYGFPGSQGTVAARQPDPPIPLTLAGGHQAVWYHGCAGLPADPGDSTAIEGYVDVGSGKRIKTNSVAVPNSAVRRARQPGDYPRGGSTVMQVISLAAGESIRLDAPHS